MTEVHHTGKSLLPHRAAPNDGIPVLKVLRSLNYTPAVGPQQFGKDSTSLIEERRWLSTTSVRERQNSNREDGSQGLTANISIICVFQFGPGNNLRLPNISSALHNGFDVWCCMAPQSAETGNVAVNGVFWQQLAFYIPSVGLMPGEGIPFMVSMTGPTAWRYL